MSDNAVIRILRYCCMILLMEDSFNRNLGNAVLLIVVMEDTAETGSRVSQ